jgi:hypothetical protein
VQTQARFGASAARLPRRASAILPRFQPHRRSRGCSDANPCTPSFFHARLAPSAGAPTKCSCAGCLTTNGVVVSRATAAAAARMITETGTDRGRAEPRATESQPIAACGSRSAKTTLAPRLGCRESQIDFAHSPPE